MYLIWGDLPGSIAQYRPDMEKRAEWPARGRAALSPFPGDILEPFRVIASLKMSFIKFMSRR